MKEVKEWDEDYLLNLKSGEYDWIEVKDSRKLDFTISQNPQFKPVSENEARNELSKQLSAFANSGGGTLVYGLEDPTQGVNYKIDPIGGVSLNIRNGTKAWLEDIIPTLTDFPIRRTNVYVLTNDGDPNSLIAQDKGIFLIEIPSSEHAPHQASDNKYYARVGGKSRPIGHQFVMDIIGRAKYPKMKLFCNFSPKDTDWTQPANFYFSCKNIGRIYANYVNGEICIPDFLFRDQYKNQFGYKDKSIFHILPLENLERDLIPASRDFVSPGAIKRYKPVLPGLSFNISAGDMFYNWVELEKFSDAEISWSIYADNAPPVEDKITIGEILEGKMSEFYKG